MRLPVKSARIGTRRGQQDVRLPLQVSLERAFRVINRVTVAADVARAVRVYSRINSLVVAGFGGVMEVGMSGPTDTIVQVEEAPCDEPLGTRTYPPGQERQAAAFIRQELMRWAGISVSRSEGRVA